jgi:hypothetical protein
MRCSESVGWPNLGGSVDHLKVDTPALNQKRFRKAISYYE